MRVGLVAIVVFAVGFGFTAGALAAKGKASKIVSFNDIKFDPRNPNDPKSPAFGLLWGDMKKGPAGVLGKFAAGAKTPPHWHTADYKAVLIQGTWIHADKDGQTSPQLQPGSYFMQPGKAVHTDECASTTDCLVYIDVNGPFDFHPEGEKPSAAGKK